MSFGCGNVVSTVTGNENDSTQPVVGPSGGAPPVYRIFAVDTSGDLISFKTDNPRVIQGKATPTGLPAGERLTGIDFRTNTGILYGITNLGKVFYIDVNTAECFQVGPGVNPGQAFANDIDFDPTKDDIRQVSDGQNIRVKPNQGVLEGADATVNIGGTPVTGSCGTAYTNNFAGATSTQLFTIDSATQAVYLQNPTTGALSNAVPFPFFFGNNVGFDFAPNNLGFIAAGISGGTTSQLLTFDPGSGTLLSLGDIGGGKVIKSLAVEIGPPSVSNFVGVDASNNLVRFNSTEPQNLVSSVAITGLGAGETVRGCDIEPGTGANPTSGDTRTAADGLNVLTLDAGNVGRIYQVNLTTGVATIRSTMTGAVTAADSSTGFDFNPTSVLLRIVNGVGINAPIRTQNDVVVPGSGTTTAGTDLSYPLGDTGAGSIPFAPAAAYTQNFLGSQKTRLFVVDTVRDQLCLMNTTSGSLTSLGGLSIDASEQTGIDIEANDRAWLVTAPVIDLGPPPVAATRSVLCRLNLTTGQADPVSNVGGNVLIDFSVLPPGI